MEYCDTCKLDTIHGGYDFCPTETKLKLDAALLQVGLWQAKGESVMYQLDSANLVIRAWQEYAAFLGVEVGNLSLFAATHGWKCPPEVAAKGTELRAKLGVDDNWQLIEKRNDLVPQTEAVGGAGRCSCGSKSFMKLLHGIGCPIRD